jgi:hypothetical protein
MLPLHMEVTLGPVEVVVVVVMTQMQTRLKK